MGIDVWEVIEAAKTKPFGFQAFYPGPGLGGHCIPIDPFYLTWVGPQVRRQHALHRAGRRDQHGDAALRRRARRRRAQRATASRSRGAGSASWAWPTRRTWTTRASRPPSRSWNCCNAQGARVSYNDPHVPDAAAACGTTRIRAGQRAADRRSSWPTQDCVLIVTDHSAYDCEWIVDNARLVVDTRNATAGMRAGAAASGKRDDSSEPEHERGAPAGRLAGGSDNDNDLKRGGLRWRCVW